MPIPPHVAPRLRIARENAKSDIVQSIPDVTDAEIDTALAAINQDAIYDGERAGWTVEVWDRVSSINGVPAQHFLDRQDVDENGNDDIYLVKQNGQVIMFQPHEPEVEGLIRIPKGQGLAKGGIHADKIAADNVAVKVLEQVRQKILANRAGA